MKRTLLGFAVLALTVSGCGDRVVELGPVADIAGLTGATAPRGIDAAEVLAGASPKLSSEVRRALEGGQEFAAVVRVLVGPDGEVIGVRVAEVEPEDSPAAEQYGTDVADSVWHWRYKAPVRDGSPVRSTLDLSFRHDGSEL
jgi:hypothetical protein